MRLLFFSHTCRRTGSELALYRLICHADRKATKMAVACGARGALAKAFPRDVSVYYYSHALSFADQAFDRRSSIPWFADKAFNAIIRTIHARVRPDAWYINTTTQGKVVALAREIGIPCFLHTHEFEMTFPFITSRDIDEMISYPQLIIAASKCAADTMRTLGRHENIEVCHESIDINGIKIDGQKSQSIRRDLKIPADRFVWAMSGSRDMNKNPLGFVRIAGELLRHEPNTHFLWIGGADTGSSLYAQAVAREAKIHENICWLPDQTDDYFDCLNIADGLVLTSLNESFSIVTVEAAALGKPFVSFNAGGPKEIFKDGMGVVVDSWNTEDMVKAMLQVMRGEVYLDANISKARAREFDISVIVKHWEKIIHQYS